jgi:hypothetical protein
MLNDKKKAEGKGGRCTDPHITRLLNYTISSVMSPNPTSACHDSSPLVSPPYRALLSSLVNGGTLNPWYGTWLLDTVAPELYSPGLALFDCKACLVIAIPEPILNSLMSSLGPPVAKDGEGDAPRLGVESPKPLPPLTSGEYGLLLDGEKDETWSNITLSSVAFMRTIMFARRSDGSGLSIP